MHFSLIRENIPLNETLKFVLLLLSRACKEARPHGKATTYYSCCIRGNIFTIAKSESQVDLKSIRNYLLQKCLLINSVNSAVLLMNMKSRVTIYCTSALLQGLQAGGLAPLSRSLKKSWWHSVMRHSCATIFVGTDTILACCRGEKSLRSGWPTW